MNAILDASDISIRILKEGVYTPVVHITEAQIQFQATLREKSNRDTNNGNWLQYKVVDRSWTMNANSFAMLAPDYSWGQLYALWLNATEVDIRFCLDKDANIYMAGKVLINNLNLGGTTGQSVNISLEATGTGPVTANLSLVGIEA